MSTNATDSGSFGGAVDDFLSDAAGEPEVEEAAPEPKKEQPAAKDKTAAAEKPPVPVKDPKDGAESDDEGAPEPNEPKDGPWRAELAKRGIDSPEVNQYMSEVIQPYMTRLEQQGGPIAALFEGDAQAAEIAAGLLNELGENPAKAIADLISLLDVSDEDINALLDEAGDEAAPTPEDAPETPEQKWVRERMQNEERDSQSQAYDSFLETLKTEYGEGFDPNLFSLAMAATGDIEGAMEMYPSLQEQYGKAAPKPPPPVMGGRQSGSAPQPEEKQYDGTEEGWAAAFGDMMSEMKAQNKR